MKFKKTCKGIIGTGLVALVIGLLGESMTLRQLAKIPDADVLVQGLPRGAIFESDISDVKPDYKVEAKRLQDKSSYFHYLSCAGIGIVLAGAAGEDYLRYRKIKNE